MGGFLGAPPDPHEPRGPHRNGHRQPAGVAEAPAARGHEVPHATHRAQVRRTRLDFFFFFFFFHLTYSRWTSSLPSCLWSQRIFPSLPDHALHFFYRDASSALLQLVNQWLNFYLLTFPRFPLRKEEHKSYFGKNRTHDFRTSRCAAYLLDHSGELLDTHGKTHADKRHSYTYTCTYIRRCRPIHDFDAVAIALVGCFVFTFFSDSMSLCA